MEVENYKSGIYEIRNAINGKRYIGSSKNIKSRWNMHKSQLRNNKHGNVKLQRSWNKHGEAVFIFSRLECVESEENLLAAEQVWLDRFDCVVQGYNILPLAGRASGHKLSEETRAKISASLIGNTHTKGRPISDEHKAAISRGSKRVANRAGIPHTEEVKQRISKSLEGNSHTLGHKLSDEHKAKLSAARRGRGSNRKGCVMSDEQKKKISETLKKHNAEKRLKEQYLEDNPPTPSS